MEVASVVQKDVPIYSEWVATLDGYVNAQIQPQVTGYVIRQTYKVSSFVPQGATIPFQIDPRPFQAFLDQANAQLAQAQAQLGKTQMDVDRDTPLAKARAIAQSQLDNDVQANRAAQAAVKAAEAQVEQARLNLEFTDVKSLIDGISGIAQVQIRKSRESDDGPAYIGLANKSHQGIFLNQRTGVPSTSLTEINALRNTKGNSDERPTI